MAGVKPWHVVVAVLLVLLIAGVVWLVRSIARAVRPDRHPGQVSGQRQIGPDAGPPHR